MRGRREVCRLVPVRREYAGRRAAHLGELLARRRRPRGCAQDGGQRSGAGSFVADGDVEGDDVSLAGSIRIGGLLNAERLCIRLDGNSRVGSIGGGEIRVERGREGGGFLGLFRKNGSGMLSVSTIEGDKVTLENTEAETVRGREVVISSGCKIGCVEYTVSLRVEGDGQVAERRQV